MPLTKPLRPIQPAHLQAQVVAAHWRLIPPLATTGKLQMAIDTWLLDQHQRGLHPPTLRFYTWEPAALSLGYHQRHWPEHWATLRWQNQPLELVRRPSGGRAVLHQGDLTYAVVVSGLTGSRLASYQYLCEFLRQGWRSLGWALNYGQNAATERHHPNCFALATGADLVLETGYKLIGSAQLRRQQAILQHGSMRLCPDPTLGALVFGERAQESSPPPDLPTGNQVMAALTAAAIAWFGIELINQPFSESEWQSIRQLQHRSFDLQHESQKAP